MHYNGAMCAYFNVTCDLYLLHCAIYTGHKGECRGTIFRSSSKLGTTIGGKHSSEFAPEVAPLASGQSTDPFWKVIKCVLNVY